MLETKLRVQRPPTRCAVCDEELSQDALSDLRACGECLARFHRACGETCCPACGGDVLLESPREVPLPSDAFEPHPGGVIQVEALPDGVALSWPTRTARERWTIRLVGVIAPLVLLGLLAAWHVGLAIAASVVVLLALLFSLEMSALRIRRLELRRDRIRIAGLASSGGFTRRALERSATREEVLGIGVDATHGLSVDLGSERVSITQRVNSLDPFATGLSQAEGIWLVVTVTQWWEEIGPFASAPPEGRCPYCLDALCGDLSVCAPCGAAHHVGCRLEHGRCAACGQDQVLVQRVKPRRLPPESRVETERLPDGSRRIVWDVGGAELGMLLLAVAQLFLAATLAGALAAGVAPEGGVGGSIALWLSGVVALVTWAREPARLELLLTPDAFEVSTSRRWGRPRTHRASRKQVYVTHDGSSVEIGGRTIPLTSPRLSPAERDWLQEQVLAWDDRG